MIAKQYKILKKLYWADKLKIKVTSEKIYKLCERDLSQALPYPFNQHVEEETKYVDGTPDKTGFISINDAGIEFVETRKSETRNAIFNNGIALWGAVTGTCAIILEAIFHLLPLL